MSRAGAWLCVLLGCSRLLVSHPLDKCISTTCNDRTCERADPVNPVVAVKAYDDGRAKTACGVETAASEVHAYVGSAKSPKQRLLAGFVIPVNSALNSDSPMPTGAMNVALCFSAASMKIVKTSSGSISQ